MNKRYIDQLKALGACAEAVEWAKQQKTRQSAWDNCQRADWMLWLLAKTCQDGDGQHRKVVLLACRMAANVQRYVPQPYLKTTLREIRLARLWTRGDATIEEVRAAVRAAEAAAWAAGAAARAAEAAAWAAAGAAGAAAEAAEAAAWAAEAAAWAAARAAEAAAEAAAWAAARAAARAAKLRIYAGWVREEFPRPPKIAKKVG